MERKKVLLVDLDDKPIGYLEKMQAHINPMLHRAFSIFIINDKKEILIQKRNPNKYHSGNLWANACCSHPLDEDLIESAKERLLDEVGIKTDLKELFSFVYMSKYSDTLYEYEYDHVLLGKYNGEIKLNLEEAIDYKWISIDELKKWMKDSPKEFASWFLICANKVMDILKN